MVSSWMLRIFSTLIFERSGGLSRERLSLEDFAVSSPGFFFSVQGRHRLRAATPRRPAGDLSQPPYTAEMGRGRICRRVAAGESLRVDL